MTDNDLLSLLKYEGAVAVDEKVYLPCTNIIIERRNDTFTIVFQNKNKKNVWKSDAFAIHNNDTLTISSANFLKNCWR